MIMNNFNSFIQNICQQTDYKFKSEVLRMKYMMTQKLLKCDQHCGEFWQIQITALSTIISTI